MRRGVLAAAVLCGCGSTSAMPEHVASSSSIVFVDGAHGDAVLVTSPDDGVLVELSTSDGRERRRIELAATARPTHIAAVGDAWWVTEAQSHEVAIVSQAGDVRHVPVPCGGTHGIVAIDDVVYVSCPHDDVVARLALDGRVLGTWSITGRPTALAAIDERLVVASSRGRVVIIDTARSTETPLVLEERAPSLPRGVAASQLDALTVDARGGIHAAYQRVEHDADRARDPSRGGYGAVVDGAPRIEPRLVSPCGDRYAVFDGGPLASSGPSALAAGGDLLWIAHLYTDDVVLARCVELGAAREGRLEVVAAYRLGRSPRGIVASPDGRTAFVDVGFDWALARLEAPATTSLTARLRPAFTQRRTLGPTQYTEAGLRGRSLFFDAADTHLTPSGVVTCGTCHPEGGEDGLSWFLHTAGVPRKFRRTPPAWAARPGAAPYHWDGEFREVDRLAQTTTHELMEGDGLLVDFPSIAAYLAELPLPPAAPLDESDRAAGEAVFARAGCDACHGGVLFADELLHAVIAPSADADGALAAVSTPSLVGVRFRAPYFHDGRAASLEDTLVDGHGTAADLDASERALLLRYLRSL